MAASDLRSMPLPELHQEHARRYQEHKRALRQFQAIKHPRPQDAARYRASERDVEATNNELIRRDREAAKAYYRNHHHA